MATEYQKQNRRLSTTVSSEEALKNALKAQYGTIIVEGAYANAAAGKIRKQHTGGKIARFALFIGIFFGPLLLVGLPGAIIAAEAMHYDITEVSEARVVLKRK